MWTGRYYAEKRKAEKKRKEKKATKKKKKKKKEKKAATVQRLKSKHCSIGSKLKNNKKIKRLNKPNVYCWALVIFI